MDEPTSDPNTGTPRWVKLFGLVIVVVGVLFLILMFHDPGGGHGPRRHLRPDGSDQRTGAVHTDSQAQRSQQ
jgi:hypothetical protein